MGVSSLTGTGLDEFFQAVNVARTEYIKDYLPQMEKLKKKKEDEELAR